MKTVTKSEWIYWLLIAAPIIYILLIWNKIPQIVPSHWNARGEIDDRSSKEILFILPGMNIFLYLLFRAMPHIDPRGKSYNYFSDAYQRIRIGIQIFFTVIAFICIQASYTGEMKGIKFILAAVFLLIAFLGNYLRKIRSNFFIGIRTPWTLDNAEVWKRTHEKSGKLWFYAGVIGAITIIFFKEESFLWIFIPFILLISLYPLIYSYVCFFKLKKENEQQGEYEK